MTRTILIGGCLVLAACLPLDARQLPDYLPAAAEEQLESSETAVEDDSRWQDLQAYTRHKIPLNTADAAALQSLGLLTPLQVRHLLDYRRLLGAFVSIYELQAVPGFDPALVGRLQPYVTVGNDLEPHYTLRDYTRKGEHALLLRYGRQLESARGYRPRDTLPPHYAGTPDRLLLRYRYHFPRYASWGVTMEKDAGEQFFKGAQKQGFDFYSAHLFIRNYRHIKALALGDFTVNMGQGLTNWQAFAFGKSPLTGQIRREGEVLRPYSSAGEFYFFRGVGITLQQRYWQLTGFVSRRSLDGNTGNTDSLQAEAAISSLVPGGYHRSIAEAARRGALQQLTAGGNLAYDNGNWHIGLNVIQHRFSAPLEKGDAPYDQFSPAGRQLFNASLDYAGTWKNVHCFGEAAVDGNGHLAMVHGLVASVAPAADVALLYRHYSRAYQSMYSNAFGNNQHPVNESGCYAAVALRFTPQLKWEAYADLFRFPWLKYRSDAPSTTGRELLMSLTYTPGKLTEAFIRYRYKTGMENMAGTDSYIAPVVPVSRRSWRCQLSMSPGPQWKLRSRLELTDYHKETVHEQGWLCYQELQYRLPAYRLRLSGRLTWFSTGGTGSSVYAMESNMLYSYSVMQLYGEGWQYNINLKWNINRRLAFWARWSRVAYRDVTSIGSGWEEVAGSRKSSVQLQVQQLF